MGYTNIIGNSPSHGATFKQRYVLHTVLFFATFISTIIAGTQWVGKNPFEITEWQYGITYALLLMLFISAHEFGHFIAAKLHRVDATLPFYIPVPFIFPFGTMGALIKTRSPIYSRKALFDIGVAGPLAGFIISLVTLIIGFLTLPGKEYLFSIHPEYRFFGGAVPVFGMYFGDTLLYSLLAKICTSPTTFIPPMNEMYHYPFLCAGWFGLFVTSLNLLPIGQLDGGHITYAMFGKKQHIIGRVAWYAMLLYGLGSIFSFLKDYMSYQSPDPFYTTLQDMILPLLNIGEYIAPWYFTAWGGWLMWAAVGKLWFKIEHPVLYEDDAPLNLGRMLIGWITVVVFVLSFVPQGIYEIPRTAENFRPDLQKGNNVLTSNTIHDGCSHYNTRLCVTH